MAENPIASTVNGVSKNPLQPKNYEIAGTHPDSRILFRDVRILDSTGREPYPGDVLIKGERIVEVGTVSNIESLIRDPTVRVFNGRGRTLMSGLCDAHTHLTWNGGNLSALAELGIEEHTLLTMRSAQCFLDSGYTMCWGAASAKPRLDVVIRDAINAGDIYGPRYLANGQELAKVDGDLVPGITAYANSPEEIREVIREHVKIGVDQIKLSISGESVTETRAATDCYFTAEDMEAAVDEAHKHGKRVCTHARARESVRLSVLYGVDVIFHASYIDDEGMDLLEKAKDKVVVVPALNWLYATLYEAAAFGYPQAAAEKAGYGVELETAIKGLKEMRRRGITVLPGGDYGFAWTPHGTYARDLEHFVKLLGFTPMEAIIAATAEGGKLFMREHELGKIQPGYYADCILVNGDPLEDITILQDHSKLDVIAINGRVHKSSPLEHYRPIPIAGEDGGENAVVPDFKFLTVERKPQIDL
ncbi:unnamed protein product [Tuber aestivum]|uniref:Amidohydrolase-related domain-containing protein n=1 Tax=Tuber aestivum TaxID=59557 RepID=A0A292PWE5_9PEZI|nr:unnamed protein product [Tuber aestivum]